MDEQILDAHAELRVAALGRHALFAGGDGARQAVREKLAPLHSEGTVRVAEHRGRVTGVLAWRHDATPWYGVPVSSVAIDYDVEHDVTSWIDAVLDDELAQMEADLDLLLDAGYRHAYRALRERGVGIDSLQLFGRPEIALARLDADRRGARTIPDDLALIAMEPAHTDAVIELSRATFTTSPEYCWFGANEGFLAYKRAELERDLERGGHVQRVLLAAGRVVGHCSASVREDPLWGPAAGMSLILAPELRGRGLLRALYLHLLEDALHQGARTMKGGTSQPPVLCLGRIMERPAYSFVMRRKAAWPDSHFSPYLPL